LSPVTGTITGVRDGGPTQGPHGELHRYYLDISAADGSKLEGGAIRQKPETPAPQTGQEIVVEVKPGQYGPMLTRVQPEGAAQAAPRSGGRPPARTDATGRSIERQVALKCATEYACAFAAGGTTMTASQITAFAEELDLYFSPSARPETPPPAETPAATPQATTAANGADSAQSPPPDSSPASTDDIPF
jgi:hypothetical protein